MTNGKPAPRPDAFHATSYVYSSADMIVAGYYAAVAAYADLRRLHLDAVDGLERINAVTVALLDFHSQLTPNKRDAMTAVMKWNAVGAALYALDALEQFGGLSRRARWPGQGRYGLYLDVTGARFLLGAFDSAEALALVREQLESDYGAPVDTVRFSLVESHPPRM